MPVFSTSHTSILMNYPRKQKGFVTIYIFCTFKIQLLSILKKGSKLFPSLAELSPPLTSPLHLPFPLPWEQASRSLKKIYLHFTRHTTLYSNFACIGRNWNIIIAIDSITLNNFLTSSPTKKKRVVPSILINGEFGNSNIILLFTLGSPWINFQEWKC